MKTNKKGFSLAEVLFTLTIIGVIATLTIPPIVANVADSGNLIKFEKVYSELSAATRKIELNNGTINVSSESNLRQDYASVMNFIKQDTMENLDSIMVSGLKCYKSTVDCDNLINPAAALLVDGTVIAFIINSTNCSYTSGSITGFCASLWFDVNGPQPPNMVGKDYFEVWLLKKNGSFVIVPKGVSGDGRDCVPGDGTWTNNACAAYALRGKMP